MTTAKKVLAISLLMSTFVLFAPLFISTMDASVYAKAKSNNQVTVMEVGDILNLKIKGTKKKVSWSTSNKKVAKVSKKGKVTAVKSGGAVVYAKINNKTAYKCKIKVNKAAQEDKTKNNKDERIEESVEIAQEAYEVLACVNKIRTKEGLQPLQIDARLCAAAQVRAVECEQTFSHTRPDGTSCFTAFDQNGIDDWMKRAENIGEGYWTATEIVDAWMASPGHKKNILNAEFQYMGLGVSAVDGQIYWAQEFVAR